MAFLAVHFNYFLESCELLYFMKFMKEASRRTRRSISETLQCIYLRAASPWFNSVGTRQKQTLWQMSGRHVNRQLGTIYSILKSPWFPGPTSEVYLLQLSLSNPNTV